MIKVATSKLYELISLKQSRLCYFSLDIWQPIFTFISRKINNYFSRQIGKNIKTKFCNESWYL